MKRMVLTTLFISMTFILSQPGAAQEQTATIHVSGLTCSACLVAVRHRALKLKGVHAAAADMDTASTATAKITYEDSEQSPQAIAQAITELGYPATVKRVVHE
jgi:mercuric ion binding protein